MPQLFRSLLVVALLGATVGLTLDAQRLPRIIGRLSHVPDNPGDTTAPVVTITTPAVDPFDAGSTTPQTVSGTASDAVGVTSVTWDYDGDLSSGSCTGTTSWSCSVALVNGTHTVTITAYDAAGNNSTDTVGMTFAAAAADCEHCDIQTSFTTAEGWSADATQISGAACGGSGFAGNQTGVLDYGSWSAGSTGCDEVIAAANHTAGAGGRGFRHYHGPGDHVNGGGIYIEFDDTYAQTTFWVRYYARFESGYDNNAGLDSTKMIYFLTNNQSDVIFSYLFNTIRFTVGGTGNNTGHSFNTVQGQATGNGTFDCYEFQIVKGTASNGTLRAWVNGTRVSPDASPYDDDAVTSHRGGSFGDWGGFLIGSNANTIQNVSNTYVDYDDIAVSTTQRVTCPY